MGVREANVERYLHDEVVKIGGTTRKWVSPGRAKVPDRIVIYHGFICFAEVKTIDGVFDSGQVREKERLEAHGAKVFVLFGHRDVDQLVHWLTGMDGSV